MSLLNQVFYSPEALAKKLGCSIDLLGRMRERGTGPAFVRFGRLFKYPESGVEMWLQASLTKGGKQETYEPQTKARVLALPVSVERPGIFGKHRLGRRTLKSESRGESRAAQA